MIFLANRACIESYMLPRADHIKKNIVHNIDIDREMCTFIFWKSALLKVLSSSLVAAARASSFPDSPVAAGSLPNDAA